MTYALNDGLHGLDIPQFCCYEKGIHLIHLRKERANRVVASHLVNNSLTKHRSGYITGKRETGGPWKQKRGQSMPLVHKGGSRYGMSKQPLLVQGQHTVVILSTTELNEDSVLRKEEIK